MTRSISGSTTTAAPPEEVWKLLHDPACFAAWGHGVRDIEDDGRGFDPKQSRPDSLGLGIMRERAAGIGATLHVESAIGVGTSVTVCWQCKEIEDG